MPKFQVQNGAMRKLDSIKMEPVKTDSIARATIRKELGASKSNFRFARLSMLNSFGNLK